MKTILASVYAVNPFKGSEDGTGWNLLVQIARFNKVIAITRENNRPHIERYLKLNNIKEAENMQFEYYDLPYWMRFWKKGSRGALLYYYLWQIGLPRFITRKELKFDITHNLNFHNDWTPSFLWLFKKPFIWGPVGHHPKVPKRFIAPVYGVKSWLGDSFRWKLKNMFWNFDPFLFKTKRRASRIFAINSDVGKVLCVDVEKIELMPAVATNDMRVKREDSDGFVIVSIGRFIALKGFDVTIAAFANFLNRIPIQERMTAKLILVGTGPELPLIMALIEKFKIEEQVQIIEWIEREDLKGIYAKSKIFLFPSHEGAGMVVPEALSCGIPVLCFDNAGPGEFINDSCGVKIPYMSYNESIIGFADALFRFYNDSEYLKKMSAGARKQFEEHFQWFTKGETMKKIYQEVCGNL